MFNLRNIYHAGEYSNFVFNFTVNIRKLSEVESIGNRFSFLFVPIPLGAFSYCL